MTETPTLTVERASAAERGAVDRLLQLYLHDFSEIGPSGDPVFQIGDDGRFPCDDFDEYWEDDAELSVHVFRQGGRLTGFAFVNAWSPSGQHIDHGLAEFFVLRGHRRSGVGWDAAIRLFSQSPGVWEVGVRGYNVPAMNFWRTALRDEAITDLHEFSGEDSRWQGTIFRFRSGGQ